MFGWNNLASLYCLNNIDVTRYFNHESRYDSALSRNNLATIKNGAYIRKISMMEIVKEHIGFHYLSPKKRKKKAANFNFFWIEYISQEVLNKIKNKLITHNIFRIQNNESTMCEFYFIGFIEYMLAGNSLLDYINLWSPMTKTMMK